MGWDERTGNPEQADEADYGRNRHLIARCSYRSYHPLALARVLTRPFYGGENDRLGYLE
jgi:hypothetical protein